MRSESSEVSSLQHSASKREEREEQELNDSEEEGDLLEEEVRSISTVHTEHDCVCVSKQTCVCFVRARVLQEMMRTVRRRENMRKEKMMETV